MITCINASLDLSNLDLVNFKYFKYPQTDQRTPSSSYRNGNLHFPETRTDASPTAKVMAMFKYFSGVLFGNLAGDEKISIKFDPQFGAKWRPYFERQFGNRGKNLIEILGKGYGKNDLLQYGAVSKET